MKLALKPFQDTAYRQLLQDIHLAKLATEQAAQFGNASRPQTVLLSAPTGSGKTVVMAAVIEALLCGNGQQPAIPGATILWLSDDPELNRQTGKRIATYTDLTLAQMPREISADDFDHETLPAGRVWLLNTQKLSRTSNLTKTGDAIGDNAGARTWSIWETLQNTADQRPGTFFVFIDEAHKGANSDGSRDTILQELVCGGARLRTPGLPIVVGMSATPDKFTKLATNAGRNLSPARIDVAHVRSSGLLKDRVIVDCPKERVTADSTLLRKAVGRWGRMCDTWQTHCAANPGTAVRPALVVQVEDSKDDAEISAKATRQVAQVVSEVQAAGRATDMRAFVHTFQTHSPITLPDGREVRWVAASEIDDDPHAQVVFFKTRLTTGWDCPRAEVMFSYRGSKQVDTITQLVGRLLRTPRGKRIDGNDLLNQVWLYLPSYDRAAVDEVLKRIKDPDAEDGVGTDARHADDDIETAPAPVTADLTACLRKLEKLPAYDIPKVVRRPDHKRLVTLSALLATDRPDPSDPDSAHPPLLADARNTALDVLVDTAIEVARNLDDATVAGQAVTTGSSTSLGIAIDTGKVISEDVELALADEDIDQELGKFTRSVDGDVVTRFKQRRSDQLSAEAPDDLDDDDPVRWARRRAKLELLAVVTDPQRWTVVEAAARDLLDSWRREYYQPACDSLDAEAKAKYAEVWAAAGEPERKPDRSIIGAQPAVTITYPAGSVPLTDHVFHPVDQPDYTAPTLDLGNDTEQDTVGIALGSSWEGISLDHIRDGGDVVGWFRNPARHEVSVCVPYKDGAWKGLYPDLLVFRRRGEHIVTDLIDPHQHTLRDAPAKARALADYAAKYGDHYNRIWLISKVEKQLRVLDLTDERVRAKVREVSSIDHLATLYVEVGRPLEA